MDPIQKDNHCQSTGQPLTCPYLCGHGAMNTVLKGGTQIRTGDKGFAGPCLTTWLCHPNGTAQPLQTKNCKSAVVDNYTVLICLCLVCASAEIAAG